MWLSAGSLWSPQTWHHAGLMLCVKQILTKLPHMKTASFFSVPARVWAIGILSLEVRLTHWTGRGKEVGPCSLGESWGGLNLIFWDYWFKDNVRTWARQEVALCLLVSRWAELGGGESSPKQSIDTWSWTQRSPKQKGTFRIHSPVPHLLW